MKLLDILKGRKSVVAGCMDFELLVCQDDGSRVERLEYTYLPDDPAPIAQAIGKWLEENTLVIEGQDA